jgi:hypothetical protein
MKMLEYMLFGVSFISWLGLLLCLIVLGASPKSDADQVMTVFCVMLLIMIISTIAFVMFRGM